MAAAAAGAAPRLHLARAPPLSPPPSPTPFPSPGHPARPAPGATQGEVLGGDPLFSGSLPHPPLRRPAVGKPDSWGEGDGRRRHSPRPGPRAEHPPPEPRRPPGPLAPGSRSAATRAARDPLLRPFRGKWSWPAPRPRKPFLRRPLGGPRLPEDQRQHGAAEEEEEV